MLGICREISKPFLCSFVLPSVCLFQNSGELPWNRLSFHRSQDELDDLDDESQEVIYYPPSEASVDTSSRSVPEVVTNIG